MSELTERLRDLVEDQEKGINQFVDAAADAADEIYRLTVERDAARAALREAIYELRAFGSFSVSINRWTAALGEEAK